MIPLLWWLPNNDNQKNNLNQEVESVNYGKTNLSYPGLFLISLGKKVKQRHQGTVLTITIN